MQWKLNKSCFFFLLFLYKCVQQLGNWEGFEKSKCKCIRVCAFYPYSDLVNACVSSLDVNMTTHLSRSQIRLPSAVHIRSIIPSSSQLLELLHPVESGAGLEPLDLRLVEGVVQRDGLLASIAVLDDGCQRLARSERLEADD